MSSASEREKKITSGLICCTMDKSCKECPYQERGLECEQALKQDAWHFMMVDGTVLQAEEGMMDWLRGGLVKRRARWEKGRCGVWKCTHCGAHAPCKRMRTWLALWWPACGFAMERPKKEKAVKKKKREEN